MLGQVEDQGRAIAKPPIPITKELSMTIVVVMSVLLWKSWKQRVSKRLSVCMTTVMGIGLGGIVRVLQLAVGSILTLAGPEKQLHLASATTPTIVTTKRL